MRQVDIILSRAIRTVWLSAALIYGLGVLHFYLVVAHGFHVDGALRALDLDGEAVLPAWYSSSLILFCGFLAWVIGRVAERGGRGRLFWTFLAIVLIYMSADESAALHEQSAHVAGKLGVREDLLGGPVFRWLIFGVPAVLVVGATLLLMLRHVERRTAALLVLAGLTYLLATIVLEFVGSVTFNGLEPRTFASHLPVTVEEGFELVGLCILATALLGHLGRHAPHLEVRLRGGRGDVAS